MSFNSLEAYRYNCISRRLVPLSYYIQFYDECVYVPSENLVIYKKNGAEILDPFTENPPDAYENVQLLSNFFQEVLTATTNTRVTLELPEGGKAVATHRLLNPLRYKKAIKISLRTAQKIKRLAAQAAIEPSIETREKYKQKITTAAAKLFD